MPEIGSQTNRINAERQRQPVADPDVVATRYRLQPADLPEPRQLVVRVVVGQGVETFTPVLHFAGLAKPLVLDAANAAAMAAVAGSPLFGDWVGCLVELRVVTEAGIERIRLVPAPSLPTRMISVRLPNGRMTRGALLLVAVLLLALGAVYVVAHWTDLQVFFARR